MKKTVGFLTILLASASAFASLTISKMDMENRMRERVQAIATKADPTAFAQVQVKLKKIRSNLSFLGMETHVTPLENGQDIGPESIDSVEVKVLSKLEPFPEWLKKEITATVEVEGVRVNVAYTKPETPIRDVTAQISEFFSQELYNTLNTSFTGLKFGLLGLGILLGFGFIGLGWAVMRFSSKLEETLQKVVAENLVPMATALGQMSGTSGGGSKSVPMQAAKPAASEPTRVTVNSDSKGQFEHYPVAALAALFVDCYWTKQDGYAHYLWTQMSPTQREALMKTECVDAQYFSHIISVPARQEDYHSHAWYMNPNSKFNTIDQKALSVWVKAHLEAAHMVSPIRMDHLELSLEERLKMAASTEVKKNVEVKGLVASAPRVLAQKLRIATLSEADELYLFKNHASIHQESREQLKSLVWLALVPVEQRRKILDEMDARQLAEAWSAPKPVLEEMKKALSPKKLEMLEHFLKTNEPGRDNDVYAYLVDAGMRAVPAAPTLKVA